MGHDIIAGQMTDQQIDQLRERLGSTRAYTPEEWDKKKVFGAPF